VKTPLVVFVALVAGCAGGPVATSHSDDVPASRILTKKWLTPEPKTGRLIVKRDSGVVRAMCHIRVYVDGAPVADLGPSEKIQLFVPVGDRRVRGETRGICGGGESEITMAITAKERRVVRIVSGKGEGIELRATFF
jgi:hypothetical protein